MVVLTADNSLRDLYYDWLIDQPVLLLPAQAYAGQFLATFRDYPPRQEAQKQETRLG